LLLSDVIACEAFRFLATGSRTAGNPAKSSFDNNLNQSKGGIGSQRKYSNDAASEHLGTRSINLMTAVNEALASALKDRRWVSDMQSIVT
jgi:hypothetical protein